MIKKTLAALAIVAAVALVMVIAAVGPAIAATRVRLPEALRSE